jgi:hypothetical protein
VVKFKYLRITIKMKIAFTKNLRADYIWGMLATTEFRIFCIPVSALSLSLSLSLYIYIYKTYRLKYTRVFPKVSGLGSWGENCT